MASIYNEQGHPAEVAAMREIVFRYHPDFCTLSKHTRTIFLEQANRGTQNIPMFLEQCVSYVSGLRRSNVPGEDHEDGSDTKFVTIRRGLNGGKFGYTAGIGNLANKRGTLRVVVYIEPRRTFQYFVIPYAGWSVLTCKNGQDIRLSYNRQTGRVSKIWPFEVSSFAQLCGDVRSRILDQWQGWELHPWPTQAPFRSLQSWYTAPFSDVGAPVLQQWTHIDDASPLVSPAR